MRHAKQASQRPTGIKRQGMSKLGSGFLMRAGLKWTQNDEMTMTMSCPPVVIHHSIRQSHRAMPSVSCPGWHKSRAVAWSGPTFAFLCWQVFALIATLLVETMSKAVW